MLVCDVYFTPTSLKCPKCGHEMNYSPSIQVDVPVIDGWPVCPKCWANFVKSHVAIMGENNGK